MGSKLRGPLFGTSPALSNLPKNQDLTFSTDFRQVYATVLDQWLQCPAEKILGTRHLPLDFI
jgi:uncharacterized protein (DUF1501 family)